MGNVGKGDYLEQKILQQHAKSQNSTVAICTQGSTDTEYLQMSHKKIMLFSICFAEEAPNNVTMTNVHLILVYYTYRT